jgi:hypothetical protein
LTLYIASSCVQKMQYLPMVHRQAYSRISLANVPVGIRAHLNAPSHHREITGFSPLAQQPVFSWAGEHKTAEEKTRREQPEERA